MSFPSSSLRKCHKWQQPNPLENLLAQRRDLIDWWSSLPEQATCRDLNPACALFRCNVHLKLDYCLTRIFMGRPFLFSNVRSGSQMPSLKASTSRSKMRAILVNDCVEAAIEIVDLCRLLRDETGLARASYTEFSSCRAALLVILAQSLTERTERLRKSLSLGMGLIKIMSMGIGSARSAVNVIEALERAMRRLEDWSETQGTTRTLQDSIDSGYERFKSWEMLWKTGPISPITGKSSMNGESPQRTVKGNQDSTVEDESRYSGNIPVPESTRSHVKGMEVGSNSHNVLLESLPEVPAESLSNEPDVKTFSQPYNANGQLSVDTSPLQQFDFTHPVSSSVLPSGTQNPQFGFEAFISNFPQELDEFTAISFFDTDNLAQGAATSGSNIDDLNGGASTGDQWLT